MQWTGKSPHRIHPKHLVWTGEDPWYRPYADASRHVLDLGCAHGGHLRHLAGPGRTVTGLDRDRDALQIAMGQDYAGLVEVRWADLEAPLALPSARYDLIVALDVLEHLVERQAFLAECRRVAAPRAWLCLSAPNRETRWRRRLRAAGLDARHDADHLVEYTLGELEAELRAGGWRIERLWPVVLDTPWAGLIDLIGGLSLTLYAPLVAWKRRVAAGRPSESTGWRALCRAA